MKLAVKKPWQIKYSIVLTWHIDMLDRCRINFPLQMNALHGNECMNAMDGCHYQMELYVNEPCADLACGANHRNSQAEES